MNKSINTSPYVLLASLVGLPSLAQPHHAEFMTAKPFLQGISMPIHGLDHMLVTVAVGLIAAQLGGKALWAIPGIFTVSVILGGILNIMGVPVHSQNMESWLRSRSLGACSHGARVFRFFSRCA
jgi:hydrogenase/urease accessory protein HupE